LREQGVKYDVILLIHGKNELKQSERELLGRLHVYCDSVQDARLLKHRIGRHENFGADVATFLGININILRLTQYSRLLYFNPMTRLSHECDALLDSMHGNFSAFPGKMLEGPFDTRAFLINPSKRAYYDLYDVVQKFSFSVEQGWFEAGSIPTWGPLTDPKHDWSFARSSQDTGLFYYYYFVSSVRRDGRVHASKIDPMAWAKCVLPHHEK
jgi:hypothetical protein